MATQKGSNQTSARDANLALIMKEFERRSISRADMSKLFHLSKTATSKIANELETLGLIHPAIGSFAHNHPGVRPVNYEINPALGAIAIVDLSTVDANLYVCDFAGTVLGHVFISDTDVIEHADFLRFAGHLEDLLAEVTLPLLSLCVAVPCAVNKHTGAMQWSPRFNVDADFNVSQFFARRFGVPVLVKNDVQLLLLAEQAKGLITSDIKYALLVFVDTGLGGSFYMNSRLEDGENGLAGDIGFYPVADAGEIIPIDSAASINAVIKKLKKRMQNGEKTCLPLDMRFKHIREAYAANDRLTVEVVDGTAKTLALALANFSGMLDINFIVINGRVTQFGPRYLSIIEEVLSADFPHIRLAYSKLQSAARIGAHIAARNQIIEQKISSRNRK